MRCCLLLLTLCMASLYGKGQSASRSYPPDYTPNWGGSLLQINADNMYPKQTQVQAYGFFSSEYGNYSNNWKLENSIDTYVANPFLQIETGITCWLDITLNLDLQYVNTLGHSKLKWGDITVAPGIQLIREVKGSWKPDLRIYIEETFPTGEFDNLAPTKVDPHPTGEGSYQTAINLVYQKTFYAIPYHPFEINLNLGYTYYTKTHVSGYNAYGGGLGTDGVVNPGGEIWTNISTEICFNPKWAFACDLNYVWQNDVTFVGTEGVLIDGQPATMGSPPSDTLSITPSIEYMWGPSQSLLVGVWFTLAGRNTEAFIAPSFLYTWTF